MEKLQMKDWWKDILKKTREAYPSLDTRDLQYVEGKEQELFEALRKRTGKEPEELVKWVSKLSRDSTLSFIRTTLSIIAWKRVQRQPDI